MSESQTLLHIFALEVLPLLMELALIGGLVGAICCIAFFYFLDVLAEFFTRKSRAKGWLAVQAKKRAAERGDDAAGRACETRSGDAA